MGPLLAAGAGTVWLDCRLDEVAEENAAASFCGLGCQETGSGTGSTEKAGPHGTGSGHRITGATIGGAGGKSGEGWQTGARGTTGESHTGTTGGAHGETGAHWNAETSRTENRPKTTAATDKHLRRRRFILYSIVLNIQY